MTAAIMAVSYTHLYLISDNVDTYTGMRLAGVDGVVVHERDELKKALEDVLADKTVGIVLLTEKFGREFPDIIDTFRLERKMPLLVETVSYTHLDVYKRQAPASPLVFRSFYNNRMSLDRALGSWYISKSHE